MARNLSELGLYPKSAPKNKVYYVNRLNYGFSYPACDASGKKIPKTNPNTGLPLVSARGEPEFVEVSVQFKNWLTRFTEYGYWSVYEVTPETEKTLAEELKKSADSHTSEVKDEKAFIKYTNPNMLREVEEKEALQKENEDLKAQKTRADEEIARLKQKAGIR